ncbi:MAG: GTP-binding protein [Candidatus Thorarchaeota archaeon]
MNSGIHSTLQSGEQLANYLKIVLVGDSNVGKTTLLDALSGSGEIGRGYSVALELPLKIHKSKMPLYGRIYDLRSQRYFPYLHSLYYNNAKGAIIVFDLMKRKSFESITKWRDIIWGHSGNIPILICGNKTDLRKDDEDHVKIEEVISLTKKLEDEFPKNIPYIELSALKRIIAFSTVKMTSKMDEDIYPTVDAFREPFINWLIEIAQEKKR